MIRALKDPDNWPGMILVVGTVLRAWQATTALLWYDESFTYLVAQQGLQDVLRATMADVHPPLYYVLMWGLLRVLAWLPPVLVLRGFSVLCGVLALNVFWALAQRLLPTHSARLAALALLAGSPVAIYYSQDARMYALLLLLVMLAVLAVLTRRWWLLGLACLAILYTHNYGLFYVPMVAGLALLRELWTTSINVGGDPEYIRPGTEHCIKCQFGYILAALAGAGLLWLPWAYVLVKQMGMVGSGYWIQPVTGGSILLALLRGWYALLLPLPLQLLAILGLVAGLVLVLINGLRNKRLLLLWWAAAPLGMAVLASLLWQPILLHRGLYGSLPAMALLAGGAVVQAKNAGRVGRWLLLAPLALALAWQIRPVAPGTDHSGVYWAAPGAGPVYHLEDTTMVIYSANYPGQHVLIDSGCPEQISALTPATRAALGFQLVDLADLPQRYTLAATMGPMCSACAETVLHNLTDQAQAEYADSSILGMYGVWKNDP